MDDIGNVVSSANPGANPSVWSVTEATGPALYAISCPDTSLCVATDATGDVVTSSDPTSAAPSWTTANVDGDEAIFGVACPTDGFCAAVDDFGDLLTTTNPTTGPWTVTDIDGDTLINGISCPTVSFCAAVDDSGNVLVSTNPTGGAGAWVTLPVDTANSLLGISCPSIDLCVAVDDAGDVVTSTAPATASSWSVANVDNSQLNAVSCPSAQMCVAVDASGGEVNSINPTGGASEWTSAAVFGAPIWSISCPSTAGCEAVDGTGQARWGAPTPSNLTLPAITGTPQQGMSLSEQHGTWTDSPTGYQLQWERCDAAGGNCNDIPNATGQQYVPVAADVGSTIRVLESASNANGAGVVVQSNQTSTIAAPAAPKPAAPASTVAPQVTGVGKVGATLACSTGGWTGTAQILFSYVWLRDGTPIPGATGSSYTATVADATHTIACRVTATNAAGTANATSPTVEIAALPACYGLAGTALSECRALQAERSALARCAAIPANSKSGRRRRNECVTKAKLAYKRTVAIIACARIKNAHRRAWCMATARKLT